MSRPLPPAPQGGVTLTARLAEAVGYALEVHGGHVRKGTPIPYVSHLLAVAALLHDAVEDGGGKPRAEKIRRRFGRRVARIVREVSRVSAEAVLLRILHRGIMVHRSETQAVPSP